MFNFLSMIAGALIAIMTSFNGILSTYTGNYTSSVLIHFVGLIGIILVLTSTSSGLGWPSVRASASRCACPPERRTPPLPTRL